MFRLLCSVSGRDASSADNFSWLRDAIGCALVVGLTLGVGLGLAASCQAQIVHGDFSGATVDYLMVTESSAGSDPYRCLAGRRFRVTPSTSRRRILPATSQLHVPAVDQTDGHRHIHVLRRRANESRTLILPKAAGLRSAEREPLNRLSMFR